MSERRSRLPLRPVDPGFLPTLERAAGPVVDLLPIATDAAARKITDVYFVGCGGSYASSIHAAALLRSCAPHLAPSLLTSPEFLEEPPARLGETALVVAAAHSGTTAETVSAASLARRRGALLVSLSRDADSELASHAHHVLDYGSDRTITAAKQIILARLALALMEGAGHPARVDWRGALGCLPAALAATLASQEGTLAEAAATLAGSSFTFVLAAGPSQGAGYLLSMCYLMEMQWMLSAFFPAGEFFHGAFEMATPGTAVVSFIGEDPSRALSLRADVFARAHTRPCITLDSAGLDLPGIPAAARAFVAPIALGVLAGRLVEHLEAATGHSLDERRYMGKGGY